MADIDELIRRSSIGEGMSWVEFGRHVSGRRARYRLASEDVADRSGLPLTRLAEIEGGCPDHATRREVAALERAMDLAPGSLERLTPRPRWIPVEERLPATGGPGEILKISDLVRVSLRRPDGTRYVSKARLSVALSLEEWEPTVLGHVVEAWMSLDEDPDPYVPGG